MFQNITLYSGIYSQKDP